MSNTPKSLPILSERRQQRFWSNVAVAGPDDCWEWQLSRFRDGYGQVKVRGQNLKAHRLAFFLATGIDPAGLLVCHSCDHPPCCNPAHLFLGTNAVNINDAKDKGRLNTAAGALHGSRTKPESRARGERVAGAVLTAAAVADIRALYASGGVTQQQLADRFGVKRETIGGIVRGEKWKHVDVGDVSQMRDVAAVHRGKRGADNRSAKLTENDVRFIRDRYSQGGISLNQLALQFGVSVLSIKNVIHRHTWDHVK